MEGEWVKPRMKGYLMKCCDCGLVHKLDFKVMRWGRGHKVIFRGHRVKSRKKIMKKVKHPIFKVGQIVRNRTTGDIVKITEVNLKGFKWKPHPVVSHGFVYRDGYQNYEQVAT